MKYRIKRESKTARMHLLIRPTTKELIKKEAMLNKLSMNDLVNKILEKHFEEV